jgi:sulfide dehydrogenase cytochrome subunit
MKRDWLMALLLCGAIPAGMASEENITGRTIGSACFGCHGAAGALETSIPPIIIGVPEEYLVTAMQRFRDGSRKSTIMGRIAKGYTDEEITAVARFFAGLGEE